MVSEVQPDNESLIHLQGQVENKDEKVQLYRILEEKENKPAELIIGEIFLTHEEKVKNI